VLVREFTAECAEFAEVFKVFLCELSDLSGEKYIILATTPKRGTTQDLSYHLSATDEAINIQSQPYKRESLGNSRNGVTIK